MKLHFGLAKCDFLILFKLKLDSGHDRSRTYVDDPYTAPDQKYFIFYAAGHDQVTAVIPDQEYFSVIFMYYVAVLYTRLRT